MLYFVPLATTLFGASCSFYERWGGRMGKLISFLALLFSCMNLDGFRWSSVFFLKQPQGSPPCGAASRAVTYRMGGEVTEGCFSVCTHVCKWA